MLKDDQIIVRGPRDALLKVANESQLGLLFDGPSLDAAARHHILAEVILMPGTRLLGQTRNTARASLAPDLRIVALHRSGQTAAVLIGRMRLKTGNILLLEGPHDQVDLLDRDPDLSLLMPPQPRPPTQREVIYTVLALFFAGSTSLLPFSVALLLAVLGLGSVEVQDSHFS